MSKATVTEKSLHRQLERYARQIVRFKTWGDHMLEKMRGVESTLRSLDIIRAEKKRR